MKRSSKVYLVGAGPGDPELLTVKAQKLISKADILIYDRLIHQDLLQLAPSNCKKVYVGKKENNHILPQAEINQLLIDSAKEFSTVVRLKGGDPFIFGRGGEEVLELEKHKVAYEIIPGVSSATGVPSHVGIPLTSRGIADSFTVITGHSATNEIVKVDWSAYVKVDTLVILMGIKNRQQIAKELIKAGRNPDETTVFIENGTRENQKVLRSNLKETAEKPLTVLSPAIIIIGNVTEFLKK